MRVTKPNVSDVINPSDFYDYDSDDFFEQMSNPSSLKAVDVNKPEEIVLSQQITHMC